MTTKHVDSPLRLSRVLDRFHDVIGEENFRLSFLHHLRYTRGTDLANAKPRDKFECLALAVRDRVVEHMISTQQTYEKHDVKCVYYFSLEFLVGRQLLKTMHNLGVVELVQEALARLDSDLEELASLEPEPALGNGGLGRLAACFMDSLATLGYPAYGYGICYELGLFRQRFRKGRQVEQPDDWLSYGYPWLLQRPDQRLDCPMYGHVVHDDHGDTSYHPLWTGYQVVQGEPWDLPMVGYGVNTVNLLRLFRARSRSPVDMERFNQGDFVEALYARVLSETLSRVLYPVDTNERGRQLRLGQEYFLVACGIRDIVRRYRRNHDRFDEFPDKVAIQMNDTHPAIAVAELQRYFVDDVGLEWAHAWGLVTRTLSYTNHTLMPEALEKWPVSMLQAMLPRHYEILVEIDRRFMSQAEPLFGNDLGSLSKLSIFEHGPATQLRMGNLAVIGSHKVNGVADIHSQLLQKRLFPEFASMWPGKFCSVTNGITPRRWLVSANPHLSEVISSRIGEGWITDLEQLHELEDHIDDQAFLAQVREAKAANKKRLAQLVLNKTGIQLPEDMLFDVHAKRLHEYKRQLLNAINIVDMYLQLREEPDKDVVPRACLFAAKAAPSYDMAKLIIYFINSVANVVNNDKRVRGKLKVAFIPDYSVSLAERLIPGADLSEQISLAGTEASGTGNMKFAVNGALTLGTLDGANIEIRDAVGAQNIFIFGMTVEEVEQRRQHGYSPSRCLRRQPRLQAVLAAIRDDMFSPRDRGVFMPLVESLVAGGDHYMLLADYADYARARRRTGEAFRRTEDWQRKVVTNIAHMGRFSSDRSIREYATAIWGIQPVDVPPVSDLT